MIIAGSARLGVDDGVGIASTSTVGKRERADGLPRSNSSNCEEPIDPERLMCASSKGPLDADSAALNCWQLENIEVGLKEADAGEFASEEDVARVREKFAAIGTVRFN